MNSKPDSRRALRARRLAAVCALSSLLACATQTTVDPPLATSAETGRTLGVRVEYKGLADYVPRSLRNEAQASLVARYTTDARTQRDDTPAAIVMYNPLTIFGFPTGSSTVSASGTLEVLSADRVVRQYRAAATVKKRNSLYTGDSLTELRKRALIAVRDNLDAQLLGDWEALASAGVSEVGSR